jgi:hypothetical protein
MSVKRERFQSLVDENHLQHGDPTERQREIAQAVIENKTYAKAARVLGMNPSSVKMSMERLKRKAARKGYYPEGDATMPVLPGMYLKGLTTQYAGPASEGNIISQYVLQRADSVLLDELAREMAEAFFSDRKPLPPAKAPKKVDDRLLAVLPICDVHVGLLADQEETGDSDYDIRIATKLLTQGMEKLLLRVPSTKQAVVALLGDICHYDGPDPKTSRSGNFLDSDTRYWKVARVAYELVRQMIDQSLRKFESVHLVSTAGNHDPVSGVWMEIAIKAAYANEKRLTMDFGPRSLKMFTHGVNILGFAHGHEKKFDTLGELLVADYPEEAHRTERLVLSGHVHHEKSRETRLARVESFRTLAPKDAWHTHSGYRSGRDLKAIILDDRFGEVERHTISVRQLEE